MRSSVRTLPYCLSTLYEWRYSYILPAPVVGHGITNCRYKAGCVISFADCVTRVTFVTLASQIPTLQGCAHAISHLKRNHDILHAPYGTTASYSIIRIVPSLQAKSPFSHSQISTHQCTGFYLTLISSLYKHRGCHSTTLRHPIERELREFSLEGTSIFTYYVM